MRLLALSLLLLACGCTSSTLPQKSVTSAGTPEHAGRTNQARHYAQANNAPEISRSRGEAGEIVVLWPRVIPKTDDPEVLELAALLQSRLAQIAEPLGKGVDKRPSPERVCERPAGCKTVSLGAVVTKKDKGCAVVALVGPAGAEPVRLIPWIGQVQLRNPQAAFRDPPESEVTVSEFASCESVRKALESNAAPAPETAIVDQIKGLLNAP